MITLEPIKQRIQAGNYNLACQNWGLIENALSVYGIDDNGNLAGVCATVAVETGLTFKPEEEHGDISYFSRNYYFNPKVRKALGNTSIADAVAYRGRGFIQLTGRNNYTHASDDLGLDLVSKPQTACEPSIAAKILAWYWTKHKLNRLCEQVTDITDGAHKILVYQEVRRIVNGGLNGLTLYLEVLQELGAL